MKLTTVTERVWELAQSGMSQQEVADAVLSTLSAKAMRALAEEYIFTEAESAVRRAEYLARRAAAGGAPTPDPRPEPANGYHGTMRGVRSGCACAVCADKAEFERDLKARSDAKFSAGIHAIVEDYKATIRAEWTEELLASTFGTPNGRVTWAEATVDDHRAHIGMNESAIEGYTRDSSLHQLAIDEIDANGGSCLADVLVAV